MTRRQDEPLDRYLTGDLPLEALPEAERIEETRLREALGALRQDIRAPASFRADVMRAVASETPPLWRRLTDWWLQPQPVRIRPAAGALALAASAALFLLLPGAEPTADQGTAAAPTQVVTRF